MFALLDFKLFCVESAQVFDLLVAAEFDLVLLVLHEAVLLIVGGLLRPDGGLKRINLVLVRLQLVFSLLLVCILVHLDIVVQTLDLSLEVVPALLLDQDLFRELNDRQLGCVFLLRLLVDDRVNTDDTVVTH